MVTIRMAIKPYIYIDDKGKTRVDLQRLTQYIKDTYYAKVSDKGNVFVYNDNYYTKLSTREMRGLIKELMPPETRYFKDWEAVSKEFEDSLTEVREDDFDNDEKRINFLNGILNLDTGELEEHTPNYLSIRQVQCNYVKALTLDDAPTFKGFIEFLTGKGLLGGDDKAMDFLMEYMGAIFSNSKGWRWKRLLLLIGVGHSGKSQLRELTMNLVGKEHCITIGMDKLQERFGPATLYQRRMAGDGDMAFVPLAEINLIKQLTGGDSIYAEFKGKDGFSFRYDGFLWFNANQRPFFRGDRMSHVYDRFIIVKCPFPVPEDKRNPHILDKMMEEKEAIVSVCIERFNQARKKGYKFTMSENMRAEREDYVIGNNTLLSFVNDCCKIAETKEEYIQRSYFNNAYKRYCSANNIQPERLKDVKALLEEHFKIAAKKKDGHYIYHLTIDENAVDELNMKEEAMVQYANKLSNKTK